MTPNHPEKRQPQKSDIEAEQRRIDALDGVQDQAVRVGKNPEQLGEIYMQRTNRLQGKIRDLRRLSDGMRAGKTDGWEKIDDACSSVETDLMNLLKSIDRRSVESAADEFADAMDALFRKAAGIERPIRLPDTPQRIGLVAEREHAIDVLKALEQTLQTQKTLLTREMEGLAKNTKASEDDAQIGRNLSMVRYVREQLVDTQKQMASAAAAVSQLDLRIAHLDIDEARNSGKTEIAKRLLLKVKDEYGERLKQIDPEFHAEAQQIIDGNDLSPFEKQLYGKTKGNAVETAVAEAVDAQKQADIVDQLEAAKEEKKSQAFTLETYAYPQSRSHIRVQIVDKDAKPYPHLLQTLKTASGKRCEGVRITKEALELMNRPTPEGMTLVLTRIPRSVTLSEIEYWQPRRNAETQQRRRVMNSDIITVEDMAYATIDGDRLVTHYKDISTEGSVADITRKREESGHDIVRAIDQDVSFKQTIGTASRIGESLTHLQGLLSAGNVGTKRQAFVDFARNEAGPMLALLKKTETQTSLNEALSQLHRLKQMHLGVALGGVEQEIDARIRGLEEFGKLLQSHQVEHIFQTILDKSTFDADTWANWASTDLPKMLAAIAVAAAVIVTVTMSSGGAAPLWVVSLWGAAGGILGNELASEAIHLYHHRFDADVTSGTLRYTDRSRIGKYAEGQKIFDGATGKYVDMEFVKDVASPYLQEFTISFIITYATVGLGSLAAARLSTLCQNSAWVQAFMQKNPAAMRVGKWLSTVSEAARNTDKQTFLRQWMGETLDELTDEFVREKGVEVVLTQIDKRLGPVAALAVIMLRGFKPLKVPLKAGSFLGEFEIEGAETPDEAMQILRAFGYQAGIDQNGTLKATDREGHEFTVTVNPAVQTERIAQELPPDIATTMDEARRMEFVSFIATVEQTVQEREAVRLTDGKGPRGEARATIIARYQKDGFKLAPETSIWENEETLTFQRPYRFTKGDAATLAELSSNWKKPAETFRLLQEFGMDFEASDFTDRSQKFTQALEAPNLESFLSTLITVCPAYKMHDPEKLYSTAHEVAKKNLFTPENIHHLQALRRLMPEGIHVNNIEQALEVAQDSICMEILSLKGDNMENVYDMYNILKAGKAPLILDIIHIIPPEQRGMWKVRDMVSSTEHKPSWEHFVRDPAFRTFVKSISAMTGPIANDAQLTKIEILAGNMQETQILLQVATEFGIDEELQEVWKNTPSVIQAMVADADTIKIIDDPAFRTFVGRLNSECNYRISFYDLFKSEHSWGNYNKNSNEHVITEMWKDADFRASVLSPDVMTMLKLSPEPVSSHALKSAVELAKTEPDVIRLAQRLPAFDYTCSVYELNALNASMSSEKLEALFSTHALEVYELFKNTGTYAFRMEDIEALASFELDKNGTTAINTAKTLHAIGIGNFHILTHRELLANMGEESATELFGNLDAQSTQFISAHIEAILEAPSDKRKIYVEILQKIDHSQSQEIQKLKQGLAKQIIATDNPVSSYEAIESVFVRNNLPMPGKIFRVFQILYPPDIFASKLQENSSPALRKFPPKKREAAVYRDILKINIESNNRSLRDFLETLSEGETDILSLESGTISGEIDRRKLSYTLSKYETVFNQSLLVSHTNELTTNNHEDLTDAALLERYRLLRQVTLTRPGQSLRDRMVEMYAKPLGYETVSAVLETMRDVKRSAHERGCRIAEDIASGKKPPLKAGDLLKGVEVQYIHSILRNGATAPELLGAESKSDMTPFDTDVSIVLEKNMEGGLGETINRSEAGAYGAFTLVIQNRGQMQMTDASTTAFSPEKLEVFPTLYAGEGHYGIRSGFGSTQIDYIVAKTSVLKEKAVLNNLYIEIAQNGWYIPVVDANGTVLFTPDHFATLRKTFEGIRRFDGGDFQYIEKPLGLQEAVYDRFAKDIALQSDGLAEGHAQTMRVSSSIQKIINDVLSEEGVEIKASYDGSLGGARFFDMGSTGRATNLPGDFDFDYTLKIDDSGSDAPFHKSDEIAAKIAARLGGSSAGSHPIKEGGQLLKLTGATTLTGDTVDIDLSILPKSQIDYYISHEAVAERLMSIKKQEGETAYTETIAGILLAKKLLKEGHAYKKVEHGGWGGIGVENWILANGGNMLEAFRTFEEAAYDTEGRIVPLEEFKQKYPIINPGVNVRDLQHDNYTAYLTQEGYTAMLGVIRRYLHP